jgi:pilus assembly protein Flp/PilA
VVILCPNDRDARFETPQASEDSVTRRGDVQEGVVKRKEGSMDKRMRGQSMVEYALILVLIAVVVIGVLLVMGSEIKNVFSNIAGALGHAGQ